MKKQIMFAMGAVCIWAAMASAIKLMPSGLSNMEGAGGRQLSGGILL